ncbi:MAG: hypothetical protein LC101_01895 [Flavobacteriales bacterium]|nr:hypothetical protein [Flavobacteriales bacterium]
MIVGMDVLDRIAAVTTNKADKPLTDIKIDVNVIEFKASQLKKRFNFIPNTNTKHPN